MLKGHFKGSKNNAYALKSGRKIIENILSAAKSDYMQTKILRKYAEIALVHAVENYDETSKGHNLTGNTRFSFVAGIYVRGKFTEYTRVLDLIGGKYTFHHALPGDAGFYDYDTHEWVESVNDYSDESKHFKDPSGTGYSYIDTIEFLKSHKPHNTGGVSVVVASASTYVELIKDWFNLDILDTNYMNIRSDFDEAVKEFRDQSR
ncbi:MAG: hypothetical protein MJZ30_06160 [Paludibacteraceae bacterium]|nr:hypothetical protein [Paludibacteraceae bacterium]